MKVLVVSRTKMGGGRCIGGLNLDDGASVRLLNRNGGCHSTSSPYQIGEIWELATAPVAELVAPHVEDVIVKGAKRISQMSGTQLTRTILDRISDGLLLWEGGPSALFDRCVRFTGKGNGYISARKIPSRSTGFWVPDKELDLSKQSNHYVYDLRDTNHAFAYVGEAPPTKAIAAGRLVRMSLARWWRPDDLPDMEERCYVQLSGWYA